MLRLTTVVVALGLALGPGCGDDRRRGVPATDAGGGTDAGGLDGGGSDAGELDGGAGSDAGSDTDGSTVPPDAGPIDPCAAPAVGYVETWVGSGNQQVLAATVDSTGALIMTGRNEGTVDFGDGTLDAGAYHGVFVVKLTPTGELDWRVHMVDTGDDSEPKGITVDADDNVLVTGYVKGTIDFGAGDVAPTLGASLREIFVLKLGSDGGYRWAKRYGMGTGWGIAAGSGGDVVVTGQASGTNDFGAGDQTANGQGDVFVLRLGADGSFVRSTLFGGERLDSAYGIDVGPGGEVVVTGQSYGGIDFGDGARGAVGTNHLFVAGLGADESHRWDVVETGGSAAGHVVALTSDGGVIVQGDGRGAVDLGGGALSRFVAKLDSGGGHVWSVETDNAALPRALGDDPSRAGCAAVPSGSAMFLTRLSEADGSFLGGVSGVGGGSIWSVGVAPDGDVLASGWIAGSGIDLGTGPLDATSSNDAVAVRYSP